MSAGLTTSPRNIIAKTILNPVLDSIITLLILWFLATLVVPPDILPPPQNVLKKFVEVVKIDNVPLNVGITLFRIFLGWVVAMIIGTLLGIIRGSNEYWDRVLRDYIIIGLVMPGMVWAVLSVIWFGGSIMASITAVAMICFPTVTVSIYEGVKNIEKQMLDMAGVYNVEKSKVIRKIVVPSMVPFLLSAARQAFAQGWKVICLVELFGANNGIGYQIRASYDEFSIEGILAWTLVFTIIILTIENVGFGPLSNRLLRWRPKIGEVH